MINRPVVNFQESLERISELNDRYDHKGALESCEKAKRLLVGTNDLGSASLLYFEYARCHFHLSNYSKSYIKIKTAIRLCSSSGDLTYHGRLKNLSGLILQQMGRSDEAAEEFLESYAFRRKFRQFSEVSGSLTNLGLIHLTKGDLYRAAEQFELACKYAREYSTSETYLICKLNLLLTKILQGRFVESSELISDISNQSDNSWPGVRILHRTGMMQCFKLNRSDARTSISRAYSLARDLQDVRFENICLEFLGLNEYFAGNYAKAREYYDQVLAMPEPTASAVAQTLRMLTDVEIAEGNWDAAIATAARADAAINKISERIELGALWRAYGHIHTHDNDHAKAREYFEKSIDLLRQLGARYELALSHFDAGRSKAYSVEAQIEQLKAAKALFVEMEVPKRVAQVDEALGKITNLKAGSSDKTKRSLTLKSAPAVPVVIAVSRSMSDIMELVERVKDRDMSVLITGETGTGKDLLAEYIHATGNRSGGPFMAINCAAVPENLLECELFGVKKGTYTGSTADKPGLIESADGGTFYFDEIGDAPAAIQSKLLRVIETKTVRRLGANDDVRVNVRFIAATNHNLQERIASKEFRRDLYYRLAEVEIGLPPLRERREDVMPLI